MAMQNENHDEQKKHQEPQGQGIEESFARLEDIISKLEGGECSLEDSFRYYETGMKLVKHCTEQIDRVEKQIRVLAEEDFADAEL